MSDEKLEPVSRLAAAVSAGDTDAMLAEIHPDVEWEEGVALPGARPVYRGHEGFREWYEEGTSEWSSLRFEMEKLAEAPDGRVLLGGTVIATGRASGIETQMPMWQIFTIMDGKIARRSVFIDRGEALLAAGMAESE